MRQRLPPRGRIPVIHWPLRRLRFAALTLFALPIPLLAQAAVEYGLRLGGSAVPAPGDSTIAGCNPDAALLKCLNHAYPRETILAAVVICLIIIGWLAGRRRRRIR